MPGFRTLGLEPSDPELPEPLTLNRLGLRVLGFRGF